jgi:diguanylate cyclase (GGDEF)-like protein
LCALLAVTRVARRVHEQRSAQQAKLADTVAKLDELAMRDSLTGVFNRRYMQTMLEQELRRQVRRHYTLCVALLDIDHFKQVNDRYGHAVGDAVLRDVAQLLSTALSAPFAVGRWGGEEFLVLFPECTLVDAQAALRRASQAVRAHDWAQHDPALQVSFSGGVCQHRPAQSAAAQLPDALRDDLGDLLERVDRALYAAKANGRNRIEAA